MERQLTKKQKQKLDLIVVLEVDSKRRHRVL